jgi:peptidyl-prolyl cis-trans isomerase-like 4
VRWRAEGGRRGIDGMVYDEEELRRRHEREGKMGGERGRERSRSPYREKERKPYDSRDERRGRGDGRYRDGRDKDRGVDMRSGRGDYYRR